MGQPHAGHRGFSDILGVSIHCWGCGGHCPELRTFSRGAGHLNRVLVIVSTQDRPDHVSREISSSDLMLPVCHFGVLCQGAQN